MTWFKSVSKQIACCVVVKVVEKMLEEDQSPKDHHWQNRSVLEWNCQQVSHWLMGLGLEQYVPAFTAKNIDGEHLLQMDSGGLKVQ